MQYPLILGVDPTNLGPKPSFKRDVAWAHSELFSYIHVESPKTTKGNWIMKHALKNIRKRVYFETIFMWKFYSDLNKGPSQDKFNYLQ